MFGKGKGFGEFLIRKFWQVKLCRIPACLLPLFMTQDIVKIWMLRFGEPPVIHQIH